MKYGLASKRLLGKKSIGKKGGKRKMEQILVVDGNGIIRGECPKCNEWKVLEFAHSEYAAKKHTLSKGMFLCHVCNMLEKQVNPEKTTQERKKIGTRDYKRKNIVSISQTKEQGVAIQIKLNQKTGAVQIIEHIQRCIWTGNIGTSLPEVVYVVDGEMEIR